MSKIDDTLVARESRYGSFYDNANVAQTVKFVMRESPNWSKLEPDQKEALEQIASKIGRMLTGDFNYVDSWHDITGYAKLVENRLLKRAITDAETFQTQIGEFKCDLIAANNRKADISCVKCGDRNDLHAGWTGAPYVEGGGHHQ